MIYVAGPAERRSGWMLPVTWLLLVMCCIAALTYGMRIWGTLPSVDVVVRMSTTTGNNVQFFPRHSEGYTEQRSIAFPLVSDGDFHEYSASLTGLTAPEAFRLDPGSGPGEVVLQWILIESRGKSVRLEGIDLRRALRPLKHLTAGPDEDPVYLQSEGDDPHLEIAIPPGVVEGHHDRRITGAVIALAGGAALLLLIWLARSRLYPLVSNGLSGSPVGLFGVSLAMAIALLGSLGTGCNGVCSTDSMRYTGGLLLAAAALASVGAASLRLIGISGRGGSGIFLWIAVGQLALVLYVYVRSSLHALLSNAPLGTFELAIVVVASLVYLSTSSPLAADRMERRHVGWLAVELALLVAICLVIADRELPRLVMLSSDPDTHAYLARQLELRGAIPWQGEAIFGYPAGSAVLGFLWAELSLMDVRNSVTALPLLQSFLAALLVGESTALRTRSWRVRLLVMCTVLGITAAGFLIPLYASYSHMEGAGRQMAIATMAVMPVLLLSGVRARSQDGRSSILLLASLFVLATLNPINVVIPLIFASTWAMYRTITEARASWWLLAIVSLPALLLLDPYYFDLIIDSGTTNPKITINEAMQIQATDQVLTTWWEQRDTRALRFLRDSLAMGPGQTSAMFALLVTVIIALRASLKPTIRLSGASLLAAALFVFALMAADGLFSALRHDRRFYLLAPYYAFTLGQLKILLVTILTAGLLLLGRTRRLDFLALAIPGVLLVLLVRFGMHQAQRHALDPRADYCGSLGCVTPDDIQVMTLFARISQHPSGDKLDTLPRVLLPNSIHNTPNEAWVFPVAGARAFPFYSVLPTAFFYYQGDDDYTTENYKARVCHRLDRQWIAEQGVRYVFLPSNRGAACLDGMEQLPDTEEVVVRSGNSYLLRLRDQ